MTAALLERERPLTGARAGSNRSSSARTARPSRSGNPRPTAPKSTRPKLKVLDQQAIRHRARARQALLMLFIVVLLGFFGVAFVHAELVADQQELDGIRAQIAEADAHKAKIERAVEEASAPQAIAGRAMDELGMVRAHQPVYIDATVPVRDLPATLTFSGRPDRTPAFAAPATATGIRIAAGVSGSAPVGGTDHVAAPVAATTDSSIAGAGEAATTEVSQVAEGETTTLSGLTVTVAGAATSFAPAGDSGPVAPGPSGSSGLAGTSIGAADAAVVGGADAPVATSSGGQTATSIAGTRASTSGGERAASNRLGGMSAGTGSG